MYNVSDNNNNKLTFGESSKSYLVIALTFVVLATASYKMDDIYSQKTQDLEKCSEETDFYTASSRCSDDLYE